MQEEMQEMREALQQEMQEALLQQTLALVQRIDNIDERSFARLQNSRISEEDTVLASFSFPPTAANPPPFPQSRRAISKLNGTQLQELLLAWNIPPPVSVDDRRTAVLRHVGLST